MGHKTWGWLILGLMTGWACASEPEPTTTYQTPWMPDAARAFLQQADQAYRAQDFTTAMALSDSVLALQPDQPETLFLRGQIYFAVGQWAEARQAYERVLRRHRNFPGAWLNLGNVAFKEQQFAEALRYFQEAQTRQAIPQPWHAIGGAYERLGQADSARWAYENALDLVEEYAPAHASLAQWYEREGDPATALVHARQAAELQPQNVNYQEHVGMLLYQTEAWDEAISVLQNVTEIRPWSYTAWYNWGQALVQLGQTAAAQPILQQAQALRAAEVDIEQLRMTVRDFPAQVQTQVQLAEALRQQNRLDEALEVYHIAAHLAPDQIALQHNLATLYLQRGDSTEAFQRYMGVLRRDSTFVQAWINLGYLYAGNGQRAQAQRAWQNAVRYGPEHPAVQQLLARQQQ